MYVLPLCLYRPLRPFNHRFWTENPPFSCISLWPLNRKSSKKSLLRPEWLNLKVDEVNDPGRAFIDFCGNKKENNKQQQEKEGKEEEAETEEGEQHQQQQQQQQHQHQHHFRLNMRMSIGACCLSSLPWASRSSPPSPFDVLPFVALTFVFGRKTHVFHA